MERSTRRAIEAGALTSGSEFVAALAEQIMICLGACRNHGSGCSSDSGAGMIGPRPPRIVLEILFPVLNSFVFTLGLIQQLGIVQQRIRVFGMNRNRRG
jgi:hypothetical protein